jgi:hypothetical protein
MSDLSIEGFVEVQPDLFAPGVLEAGLRRFLEGGDPPVIYHYDPAKRLGTVTRVTGDKDRVEITATLPEPPERTELRSVWSKVQSGTIKGLSLVGDFTRDRANVAALSITAVPLDGSGFIEKVSAV